VSSCLNSSKKNESCDDWGVQKIVFSNYIKLLGNVDKEPYIDYYFKLSRNKGAKCYLVHEKGKILLKKIPNNDQTIFRLKDKLLFKSLREMDRFQNSSNLLVIYGKDTCVLGKQTKDKTFYLDDRKVNSDDTEKMGEHIVLKKYIDDFIEQE
jgi:hypothetical protein